MRDDAEAIHVRLRDALVLVLGVAIVIAPWFNGDDVTTHGAIRLRLVAFMICGISLWTVAHQRDWIAEACNALLGIALITAPCWRGGIDAQRLDTAAAGVLVVLFSASCAVQILRERRRFRVAEIPFRARYPFSKN